MPPTARPSDDDGFRALYAGDEFDRNRHNRWSPEQVVDIALAHPPNLQPEQGSRPGRPGRWDHSDSNYVVAGMVVEKATGGTYVQAVERLVIRPPSSGSCSTRSTPTATRATAA
ncbi:MULTISPECIES: hypothetical protein [unclassified Streptomyces]|uniref:hypothetical protein n=1 Tax=unclassified Streptomyces TaxID=2593676 RepID=UPI0033E1F75E